MRSTVEPKVGGALLVGPLLAGAYLAGTLVAAALGGPWWATAAVGALLAGALLLVRGASRRPDAGSALLLGAALLLAAAGHARLAEAESAPPGPLALAAAEGIAPHAVLGVARDDASVRGALARVDLRIESLDGMPASGGLRLTLPAPAKPLLAGERLSLVAEIEEPPDLEGFDYAAFLRRRGIDAVAAFPDSLERLGDAGGGPRAALRALRREAVANVERALPEPEAALAAGVLLGERGALPAELDEALRVTGTAHLVVVSGQNVALLLGSAIPLLTLALSRRRAALLVLLLLPAYVLLVGAEPPVVRAALMAVGIALAQVAGRRTPGWIYLLYALAAMLAWEPLLARDVAFQLPATATAGVLLLAPPLRSVAVAVLRVAPGGAGAALIELAATATGAALAVTPVQAAAFGELPLLTVPANVIVAPLYEATLAVALLGALLGDIDPAAELLRAAGSLAPAAFVRVVRALAELPGASVPIGAPLLAGAAWYAALAAATWWLTGAARRLGERPPGAGSDADAPARALAGGAGGHRGGTLWRGWPATALLAVAAGALWAAALERSEPHARVTVLDVGQGSAILVEDGGAAVLIDAGPPDGSALRALGRVRDARTLDAVIVTHADADHAGGLPELLRRLRVGAVLTGPGAGLAGGARPDESMANAGTIDIGDRVRLSPRVTLEVLSPPVVTAGRAHASDNDGSLVLLHIGDRRVLLPADIEAPAERWLVGSGLPLRADALVLPHHGSRGSSTPELVAAVRPSLAVVSAGTGNRHGHPHDEVLARYAGALLARTDQHGDVTLTSDGERLWARSARGDLGGAP